ncbi:MAG: hypothetical protein FPO08_12925 [Geobacter sp.]|nr:MAG: hypothetical protein FPO08_12925 [Geobacter sp.]
MEIIPVMYNYCIENKSWVFSGVGVAIVSAVFGFIFYRGNSISKTTCTAEGGRDAISIVVSGDKNKVKIK